MSSPDTNWQGPFFKPVPLSPEEISLCVHCLNDYVKILVAKDYDPEDREDYDSAIETCEILHRKLIAHLYEKK